MATYRRIEIKAHRRRLTTVCSETRRDTPDAPLVHAFDGVSLDEKGELVALDSAEVQLILVEALRCLDYQLSPHTRRIICAEPEGRAANNFGRSGFYLKLKSIYQFICPKALRLARKER
jgi:hypothetical protein